MNYKKPRIQFGIRTLFVLLLMASIPLAWVAFDIDKSRQRNAIERQWAARGAQVGFAADRRLIVLNYLPESASSISDEDLLHLSETPALRHLDLRNTGISDQGLLHLQVLPELFGVNLSGTMITDEGLHHLKQMHQLRVIDLTKTQVSADGIASLRESLPNCSISWNGAP